MSIQRLTFSPLQSSPGRRPSGARLYHVGSRFGEPSRRKIDRERIFKILYLAEAMDRFTRRPGQHGGLLKGKGRDVLRALLVRFYNKATGECYPAYETIAEAAGCARSTVAVAIKRLERAGFLEIVRRKMVARFQVPGERVSFDCAVQDSNSYLFNIPTFARREYGDLSLPLMNPIPESSNRTETGITNPKSSNDRRPMAADLASALARLGRTLGIDI